MQCKRVRLGYDFQLFVLDHHCETAQKTSQTVLRFRHFCRIAQYLSTLSLYKYVRIWFESWSNGPQLNDGKGSQSVVNLCICIVVEHERQVDMRHKVQENTGLGQQLRMHVHLFVYKRERVRSHDWKPGSVSDFRGLHKGLPLLAIKTQVMQKSPRAGCILQQ